MMKKSLVVLAASFMTCSLQYASEGTRLLAKIRNSKAVSQEDIAELQRLYPENKIPASSIMMLKSKKILDANGKYIHSTPSNPINPSTSNSTNKSSSMNNNDTAVEEAMEGVKQAATRARQASKDAGKLKEFNQAIGVS